VKDGPLLDQAQRSLRANAADDQLPAQVKLGLLALMFSVEVRGLVVLIEHPDHNTEERRDDRHASVYNGELPGSVQHMDQWRGCNACASSAAFISSTAHDRRASLPPRMTCLYGLRTSDQLTLYS
jgi:hypothetical protein